MDVNLLNVTTIPADSFDLAARNYRNFHLALVVTYYRLIIIIFIDRDRIKGASDIYPTLTNTGHHGYNDEHGQAAGRPLVVIVAQNPVANGHWMGIIGVRCPDVRHEL